MDQGLGLLADRWLACVSRDDCSCPYRVYLAMTARARILLPMTARARILLSPGPQVDERMSDEERQGQGLISFITHVAAGSRG